MGDPTVLRELLTGTPFTVGGSYWMTWYGDNASSTPACVGLAYSSNLVSWTAEAAPVLCPAILEPSAYLAYSLGRALIFPWDGSLYFLVGAQDGYPSSPNSEPGKFAQFSGVIGSVAGFAGSTLAGWSIATGPSFTRSGNSGAPDAVQLFTGSLVLSPNGTLAFWYNGNGAPGRETITYASSSVALPEEASTVLHLGYNRVAGAYDVGWPYSSVATSVSASDPDPGLSVTVTSASGTGGALLLSDNSSGIASIALSGVTVANVAPTTSAHTEDLAIAPGSFTVGADSATAPSVTLAFTGLVAGGTYTVTASEGGVSFLTSTTQASGAGAVTVTYDPATMPLSATFTVSGCSGACGSLWGLLAEPLAEIPVLAWLLLFGLIAVVVAAVEIRRRHR